MEKVVDLETARVEVEKWLDFKRVRESKREANKETIDALVEAVSEGQLVVNEDHSLTHTLDVPTGGETALTSLTYKPRLTVQDTHSKMKGVKANDVDGRIIALVSALCGKPASLEGKLDTSDYSISQNVALFFL